MDSVFCAVSGIALRRTRPFHGAVKFPLLCALAIVASGVVRAADVVPPPPDLVRELTLPPFYKKSTLARGVPIVASAKVHAAALAEAAWIIDHMLEGRDDVAAAIRRSRTRVAVMAVDEFTTDVPEHSDLTPAKYWNKRARGLGATPQRPAVSCGEENLLGCPGDPYATENILVHEFAHVIHQMGLNNVDPTFQKRLDDTYAAAMKAGLWKDKYAASNPAEYWAEAVQSWFDTNRENDASHNHVNTRAELKDYDPALAALVAKELGDRPWRYQRPADRPESERRHFGGLDPKALPAFSWPKELSEWYESYIRHLRSDLAETVALEWSPVSTPKAGPATERVGDDTTILFKNERPHPVKVFWLAADGSRKLYTTLAPGAEHRQATFAGHRWIATDETGRDIGMVTATSLDGRAILAAPPAQ